ncbi:unnamed protein product [Lupinus luteus]|uniref:RING-type domain-containing protein n=1 Tax=Lupinus luteus TaxID=3873 RepID=A0AAV1Y4Y7_LUPLU
MGAACCVAAKGKSLQSGSTREILHRNIWCSPTWSFRWDRRGRIAGEDASVTWFSDGISRNGGSENKNEIPYVSEDGSPWQSDQRIRCQKYPISERSAALVINSTLDQSISTNVSMDVNMEHVEELEESSTISRPSPTKPSSSLPSTLLLASPLPPQSFITPPSSTPSRRPYHSPGHQLSRQLTVEPQDSNYQAAFMFLKKKKGFLHGAMNRSFDTESFGFNRERLLRSSSRFSTSPVDLQTCSVCSKLLTEKSSWSSQKIIAGNDLAVVSVLIYGHVYHAECLESMTPEIKKYDPACPVCAFGEKQTLKLSEKALKAEMGLKARNKKSKNQIVDSEIDDDFVFDHFKDRVNKVKF